MTTLISKCDSLENTLQKMEKTLKDGGFAVTFAHEKHPLTHCYSLLIRSVEAPERIYANGKGTLRDASKASALGEYIERLATNAFFIDFYLPKRSFYPDEVAFEWQGGYLDKTLLRIYDPQKMLESDDLVEFNSDEREKIISLPFRELNSTDTQHKTIYFPINILNNLYVSNGLASGNTPKEAQVQALSEIFERYVKREVIKNGYALPIYPKAFYSRFESFVENLAMLRNEGFEVEVFDASLGGVFPVTAILLINPSEGTMMLSFGSHPLLEVALERTLTELLQGRERNEFGGLEKPTFDMAQVQESFNLEAHYIDSNGKIGFGLLSRTKSFDYISWAFDSKEITSQLDFLQTIAYKLGKTIYLREYDYLGFYACQIIIPDFSEVYPIDDLLYSNKNQGKKIRQMVLDFERYEPQEILDAIEPLEEHLDVGGYIGVIFKHSFTLQTLKAQLYLLIGNLQEALWLLSVIEHPIAHIVAELIRMREEQCIWEEYEEALTLVYTQERLQEAVAILEGQKSLIDLTLCEENLKIWEMYDRLSAQKEKMRRG